MAVVGRKARLNGVTRLFRALNAHKAPVLEVTGFVGVSVALGLVWLPLGVLAGGVFMWMMAQAIDT